MTESIFPTLDPWQYSAGMAFHFCIDVVFYGDKCHSLSDCTLGTPHRERGGSHLTCPSSTLPSSKVVSKCLSSNIVVSFLSRSASKTCHSYSSTFGQMTHIRFPCSLTFLLYHSSTAWKHCWSTNINVTKTKFLNFTPFLKKLFPITSYIELSLNIQQSLQRVDSVVFPLAILKFDKT